MQTKTMAVAAATAVAALLGVSTYYVMNGSGPDHDCPGMRVAGGGSIGGPFELISETGETVTDKDVITRPSLLYFGYTFCPDVCPFDTVRNADAAVILAEQGIDLQPVFISVDHGRDDPESMRFYTDAIHEDMLGLTGTEDQIRDVAKTYRVVYQFQETEDEDFYLVNHMTLSYLVTPEDGFVTAFGRELSPEQLADQAACHLS